MVGFSCFKNETLFSQKIPLEKSRFLQYIHGKMFFIQNFTSNHLQKMKQMKQIRQHPCLTYFLEF